MMQAGMATEAGTSTAKPALRRDQERRVIAGVCAGIANRLDLDPLVVRIVFVAATAAGGAGLLLYALGWLVMPAGDATGPVDRSGSRGGRGSVEVALGVALLLVAVLLALRALDVWFPDAVVWPLVLIAGGGALLWRQSATRGAVTADAETYEPDAAEDLRALGHGAAVVSRVGLGIALVIAAGLVFLQATGSLSAARDVVLAVVVVIVVLAVIFAPWILRLVRSLSTERAERIRSQERAEMAAHLHDSVLQTLALMQKRSSDPREVAGLARRQERELRAWLSGRTTAASGRMVGALEQAAGEVEESSGVPVEVVAVGDCDLDPGAEAVVAAAREAMLNAAKFGNGSTVDVFAELANGHKHVFVRDRGPGFDPAAIPGDRRGVRESIIGRMARNGGRAAIHTQPGGGTEVELILETEA
jgi:signal transduction histidine kinase/phage shock protein PspC (stress-responsive transcriptional regulator)